MKKKPEQSRSRDIFIATEASNPIYKNESNKLKKLAGGSSRVIYEAKSVFPFVFFTDEIMLDETKVSFHTRYFFYTKEVRSIVYSDIFNIIINQGIIFASLEIVDRYFTQNNMVINYLKKNDAVKIRRLIQGMIIAKKEKIETTHIPLVELISRLNAIGKTR